MCSTNAVLSRLIFSGSLSEDEALRIHGYILAHSRAPDETAPTSGRFVRPRTIPDACDSIAWVIRQHNESKALGDIELIKCEIRVKQVTIHVCKDCSHAFDGSATSAACVIARPPTHYNRQNKKCFRLNEIPAATSYSHEVADRTCPTCRSTRIHRQVTHENVLGATAVIVFIDVSGHSNYTPSSGMTPRQLHAQILPKFHPNVMERHTSVFPFSEHMATAGAISALRDNHFVSGVAETGRSGRPARRFWIQDDQEQSHRWSDAVDYDTETHTEFLRHICAVVFTPVRFSLEPASSAMGPDADAAALPEAPPQDTGSTHTPGVSLAASAPPPPRNPTAPPGNRDASEQATPTQDSNCGHAAPATPPPDATSSTHPSELAYWCGNGTVRTQTLPPRYLAHPRTPLVVSSNEAPANSPEMSIGPGVHGPPTRILLSQNAQTPTVAPMIATPPAAIFTPALSDDGDATAQAPPS